MKKIKFSIKWILLLISIMFLLPQLSFSQVIEWVPNEAAYRSDICCMAHNGTVLFAGTHEKGVLRSLDNGKTWEMVNNGLNVDKQRLQIFEMLSINSWVFIATSRGVFRTNNDGASWKLTGSALFIQSMVTNGKAIFTGAGTNGGSDGIYRTTDNGESWQLVKATVPTVFLADGDSVWIDDQSAGQKGISISADGGNTWKAIQTVGNRIIRGKYFKSGTTIFMTELSIFSSGDLLRSEDGGATWTLVTNVGSGVRSVFIFDGWIFAGEKRSKDNGATWESTVQNIGAYATAIGQTIFFGEYEFYRSSNYIKSASLVNCFYPIYSMLMSEQVGLHIGTDDGYFIYGRSKYVQRDIDDNKQHTYYSLAQNGTSIYAGTEDGIYSFADSLVYPLAYTQVGLSGPILSLGVNSTSSYAGTNSGIYRLKNGSKTWEKQTQVGTLAVRVIVVNNGTVTVGTDNGVYISTNDGQSWTQKNSGLTATTILALYVEGNRMLAGTPNGVFLSNNGGTSWTAINNGLSNTNVHCVAILYGKFLVGTDAGVFVSKDQGSSWHQNPTDLIKSVVTTFVIYEHSPFENRLVAGTQMQGVFYIGNYLEFSSVEEQPLVEMPEVHISPNPASDHITVELGKETSDCRVDIYDLYGSCVGRYSVGSGRSTIKTDNLSSSVYTLRVQVGGRIASRTVAIIK